MQQDKWFTPEGIEDLLPVEAEKLEVYRQKLLQQLKLFGYLQVLPPIAEFTDSLLTGSGNKLSLDTCRFSDYESGRMMGVRADMTPQIARIISNRLQPKTTARLCYVGEVLKSRNNKAKGSRSPIQVGAEMFGSGKVEADIEILDLIVHCAQSLNLSKLVLSLGHVGIVQSLMDLAGLNQAQQANLVDILQRKALPEYQIWLQQQNFTAGLKTAFNSLPKLVGNAQSVMEQAQPDLVGLSVEIDQALADLKCSLAFIEQTHKIPVHLDLMDLRGFQYHTGMIFACYSQQETTVLVAKGGRYDKVCSAFGKDYPATGFSIDLRNLLSSLPEVVSENAATIYAPFNQDSALYQQIQTLRNQGQRVIRFTCETEIPAKSKVFQLINGQWQLADF